MEKKAYQRVLVATDYSETSGNAVRTAASICRKQQSLLTLLHVVKDASAITPEYEFNPSQSFYREMQEAARTRLQNLGEEIRKEFRISVDEMVSFGQVTDQILAGIRSISPDLFIMGTHGASGFRRFFMGSTAYRVIKHTNYPVMTIPGTGDWSTFRNVLFPIRLIPDALKKYDHVRPILLHDLPMMHLLGLSMASDPESVRDVFHLEDEIENRLTGDNVNFDFSFQRCTNYAESILEQAHRKKADLIVIIATIDKLKGDFFVGQFSQQILNHAQVPVLCVRA